MGLVITQEVLSKAIQFDACDSLPEVGTPISALPQNHLVWGECLGFDTELPLFALANSGYGYGDGYGYGNGYGYGDGYGNGYGYGDGNGSGGGDGYGDGGYGNGNGCSGYGYSDDDYGHGYGCGNGCGENEKLFQLLGLEIRGKS